MSEACLELVRHAGDVVLQAATEDELVDLKVVHGQSVHRHEPP